jgi:two-component system cell cycle response regulator
MTATILVVDDLEPNVKLLEAKLLSEYYTVLTAYSGQQALEMLKNNKVDVVLLDVMMPGMDGYETCKKIKANPNTTHIPIVMVTALSEVEDRVKGLESGADEFLTKPVNDMALFARVKSLSRIKTIVDELRLRNQTNAELGLTEMSLKEDFAKSNILIIDDDVIQSKNIAKNITKLTSSVKIIDNADSISEVIKNFMPDLIIISAQLETGDPLRICVKLRTIDIIRNTPIVMIAEEETISMVIKGFELGVNDYFMYPVDENELVARIKTQLRRKQYQDSLKNNLAESINMSVKDGLTGIYNRRYFDAHLKQMVGGASETGELLMLVMLDIDHFKPINDKYGHQVGDEILKLFAKIIQNCTRLTDFAARYGGEEFALVLHSVKHDYVVNIAERIREEIEAEQFRVQGLSNPIRLTASMGVAIYKPGQTVEEFIKVADDALYKAKNSGRNKVVLGN